MRRRRPLGEVGRFGPKRGQGDTGARRGYGKQDIQFMNVVSLNCNGVARDAFQDVLEDVEVEWDVLLLQEVFNVGEGGVDEVDGHVVIVAAVSAEVRGCVVVIHKRIASGVISPSASTWSRYQSFRLALGGHTFHLSSFYLPQRGNTNEDFYEVTSKVFNAIKSEAHVHDCVLTAADFNAELGPRECIAEESLLGNFARGRRTERGEWLLHEAARHRMSFAHTFFEECDCPTRFGFGDQSDLTQGTAIDGIAVRLD